MKTTLTLDPDVAEKIRNEAALGKRSVKEIVNQALKQGLGIEVGSGKKFSKTAPHLPSANPANYNRIYEEILDQEYLEKTERYRKELSAS